MLRGAARRSPDQSLPAVPSSISTVVEGTTATVVVTGPLGLAEAAKLDAALLVARELAVEGSVALDLGRTTAVDSSVIVPIMRAGRHARREAREFAVYARGGAVVRLFEGAGLAGLLQTKPRELR